MGKLDNNAYPNNDKENIEELIHELNTMLAKQLPEAQANINQTFQTRNLGELRSYLHKLQGACAYCELPELFVAAKALSVNIKTSGFKDIATLQKLLDQINQEIKKALVNLAAKGYKIS